MVDRITFKDTELLYSAGARCRCGAGLAYPLDHEPAMKIAAWACSRVLKGETSGLAGQRLPATLGIPETPEEHDAFPWSMYKIREETSIRNEGGHTTRPKGTVAKTVCLATCPKCQHKWESTPYVACGLSHHQFPGDCPQCGYGVGAHGSYSSLEGTPIDAGYRDVVFADGDAADRATDER